MKIQDTFIMALVYLGISILIIFIPLYKDPLFNMLFLIGIGIYIFTGIIFIYCILKINDTLISYGLIIGFSSWLILLIVGVYHILINSNYIETWHFINTLESFKLISPVIDVDLPSYIISEFLFGQNINYVINSLGIVFLTIFGCIIGIFSYLRFRKQVMETS